jgi:hypothetical protein
MKVDPIQHEVEDEAEVSHLAVLVTLLGAREKPRRDRSSVGQRGDLLAELVQGHAPVLRAGQDEGVLDHLVRDVCGGECPAEPAMFVRRFDQQQVHPLPHAPVQTHASLHGSVHQGVEQSRGTESQQCARHGPKGCRELGQPDVVGRVQDVPRDGP